MKLMFVNGEFNSCEKSAGKTVFHGTSKEVAGKIFGGGFKIGSQRHGKYFGRGLYVTRDIKYSTYYGPVVIRSEIYENTRLLKYQTPQKSVIASLKREFGAGILSPEFWKCIPRNKQLTKTEVVNLWNYQCGRRERLRRHSKNYDPNFSRLFEQLRFHNFDGVEFGKPVDEKMVDDLRTEIVLFNPSNLIAVDFFIVGNWSYDLSGATSFSFEGPFPSDELHSKQIEKRVF